MRGMLMVGTNYFSTDNIKVIKKNINHSAKYRSVVPSPNSNIITEKLDSGATNQYFQEKDKKIL